MSNFQLSNKTVLYTSSHEWIQLSDKSAVIGITHLKIPGARKINKITFLRIYGPKQKGEPFATIEFDHKKIDVLMPVNGTIICLNNSILAEKNQLLNNTETDNWMARITFAFPVYDKQLLSSQQYSCRLKS